MLKKILALSLALSAVLTLCSCSLFPPVDEQTETTLPVEITEWSTDWFTEPESTTEEETTEPEPDAQPVQTYRPGNSGTKNTKNTSTSCTCC